MNKGEGVGRREREVGKEEGRKGRKAGKGERQERAIGMTHFRKGNDRRAVGSILSHPHLKLGLDYSSVSSIVIRK